MPAGDWPPSPTPYNPVWVSPPVFTQPMPQGWLCPRCGKVNAPHIAACDCKPEGKSNGIDN